MAEAAITIYPARLVRTMDPSVPTAAALAVVGDRVLAVGSVAELAGYGPASIDDRYADSVLLPGFVEAHSHISTGAMWAHTYVGFHPRQSPNGRRCPGCTDLDALIELLREADARLDPTEPLLAWGFDPLVLGGERLARQHLDAVSVDRPILVLHQSSHALTVNTAVIQRDGITRGSAIEGVVLDAQGEPTGELHEFVAMTVPREFESFNLLPDFDETVLRQFAADALNHGVTTVVDLGNRSLMSDDNIQSYSSVVDGEDFPARLSIFHIAGFPGSPEPGVAVERLLELKQRSTAKLRFGHVKLVLDGAIQGFTARLQAPGYLASDRKGIWNLPPETFAENFAEFHRAGLTVHVHCNGDESTELFLDVVEATLARHPRWDHRHTVTHSQLSTPAQYRRMAALGMCANLFINHLWYWGDQHATLTVGPDRAARMNAAATALRAGVPISFHSDTPITPLDPLATASIATTRRSSTGRILGPNERVGIPEALHAITLGAAHLLKMDQDVGSIEPGKYADFAVLAEDPFTCDGASLRDIQVRGTVVGGRHFTAA